MLNGDSGIEGTGRRQPHVRADLLLHNLEAIAADMAAHQVSFKRPLSSSEKISGDEHNGGSVGGEVDPHVGTGSGRPSTGQLKNHVNVVQKRIDQVVHSHFDHSPAPMEGTILSVASTLRSGGSAAPAGFGGGAGCMYSTLVHTARREGAGCNSERGVAAEDEGLYRLPGIVTHQRRQSGSNCGPMSINHFSTSMPRPSNLSATSLHVQPGNQSVSARLHRAILDGSTSSSTLRELTLVAERQRSPRGIANPRGEEVPHHYPTHLVRNEVSTPRRVSSGITLSQVVYGQSRAGTKAPPPPSPRGLRQDGKVDKPAPTPRKKPRQSDASLVASLNAVQGSLQSMPKLDVRSVRAALGTIPPRPPLPPTTPKSRPTPPTM
jgi:hypothetical protein